MIISAEAIVLSHDSYDFKNPEGERVRGVTYYIHQTGRPAKLTAKPDQPILEVGKLYSLTMEAKGKDVYMLHAASEVQRGAK